MELFPQWLQALPDADAMRAVDRWAIEQRGVAGLELMERAGAAATRELERIAPAGPVTVICGKGNNGGDGLVIARMLRAAGRSVTVACTGSEQELRGDAKANLQRLPGERPVALADVDWQLAGSGALVDALLGTGFAGEPRGDVASAIDAINSCGARVLSVDVPSGVDASSGEAGAGAVRASLTVTFHAAKPGLWINPGKSLAGEVQVVDIGIPRGAPGDAMAGLITDRVLHELPSRGAGSTKFSSGHVTVIGGSLGMSGAPALAARASMRAGAGYVTLCVPGALQSVIAGAGSPELMVKGMTQHDGELGADALHELLDAAAGSSALVLGPGAGRGAQVAGLMRELARAVDTPLVLDADALNAHAGALQELAGRTAPTILTPHAGELARLLQISSAQVESRRLLHARRAAQLARAIVVLKGDDTIIAEPGGLACVSPGASPALATAGTGDVLAGTTGALLAKGVAPLTAAAAAVTIHARAGRLAAQRFGSPEGVIASDVIEQLAAARTQSGSGT